MKQCEPVFGTIDGEAYSFHEITLRGRCRWL